jgi:hypothetical protein
MKTASYVLLGLSVLLFGTFNGTALAGYSAERVVYPTGVWPDDVNNVRAVATLGGQIKLKAINRQGIPTAFNFGSGAAPNAVSFSVDVVVSGETFGRVTTTILGGLEPFLISKTRARIEGITFQSPLLSAIVVKGSNGVDIGNNRIEGVIPYELLAPDGTTYSAAYGVILDGTSDDITGSVLIAGNVIGGLAGDNTIAIQLDSVAAQTEILDNEISVSEGNIGCVVNCTAILIAKMDVGKINGSDVLVAENHITMGVGSPEASSSYGISFFGSPSTRFNITDNTISSDSAVAFSIVGTNTIDQRVLNDAVVFHNRLSLSNSQYAAIYLSAMTTKAQILGNVVSGSAGYGIYISWSFDTTETQVGTEIAGNDLKGFSSSGDIYLDTTSSDSKGSNACQSVVDLGVNNHVSCH